MAYGVTLQGWTSNQYVISSYGVDHVGNIISSQAKIQGRKQWPMLSINDLVTALAHLLPRRQLTAEDLTAIIDKRYRLRQRSKESCARRTQAALE